MEPEPEVFEVELFYKAERCSIKKRSRKQDWKNWRYLVKWVDYPESENSWERGSVELKQCEDTARRFWDEGVGLGIDPMLIPLGGQVEASQDWIEKEKIASAMRRAAAAEAYHTDDHNDKTKPQKKPSKRSKSLQSSDVPDNEGPPSRKRRKLKHTGEENRHPNLEVSIGSPAPLVKVDKPRPSKKQKNTILSESETEAEPADSRKLNVTIEHSRAGSLFSATATPFVSPPLTDEPGTPQLSTTNLDPNLDRATEKYPSPPSESPKIPAPSAPKKKSVKDLLFIPSQFKDRLGAKKGISTKQRISQGALDALPPNEIINANARRKKPSVDYTPATTEPSTTVDTSFQATLGPTTIPIAPELVKSPLLPEEEPLTARVESPKVDLKEDLKDPMVNFERTASLSSSWSTWTPDHEVGPETVIPLDIFSYVASPMDQPMDLVQAPLPAPEPSAMTVQPSILDWRGSLVLPSSANPSQGAIRFRILVDGETELRPNSEFRLLVTLLQHNFNELHFESVYNLLRLSSILSACQRPAYCARVSRDSTDDHVNERPWRRLLTGMYEAGKVALIPIDLGNNLVSHLLLQPSRLGELSYLPRGGLVARSDTFVAFLLPWAFRKDQTILGVSPKLIPELPSPFMNERHLVQPNSQYNNSIKDPRTQRQGSKNEQAEPEDWARVLKGKPVYQLSMRVLGFPANIQAYLQSTQRRWTIYRKAGVDDGPSKCQSDMDSEHLRTILDHIKNEKPCIKEARSDQVDHAQIIFIHAGALNCLDAFPNFVDRILHRDYTRFYLFGTDPSVSLDLWGVREIYPCGGVITVTPRAIWKGALIGTMKRLTDASRHPFWLVYVLPSVVGMIARLWEQHSGCQASPSNFPFPHLLDAISRGDITFLEAPSHQRDWLGGNGKRTKWGREPLVQQPTAENALRRGLDAFRAKYEKFERTEWEEKVNEEVVCDLKTMQRQQSMMANYRRYVVLSATKDERKKRGSVEWLTPIEFDFKDEWA